jgi:cytochrome P450
MGFENNLTIQTEASNPLPEIGLPAGPHFSLVQGWKFIFRPRRYYAWLRQHYGNVVTLDTPEAPLVLTLTAEGARQVLTSDPAGYDAWQKEAFTGIVGAGSLWVLEGSRHRRERKLLMPAFHTQNVCNFGRVIREITLCHTDGWRPDQRIRAYDAMLNISRDVILRMVFGIEGGPLLVEGRRVLTKLLETVHPLIAFMSAFQAWWFPPWHRFKQARRQFSRFVTRCAAEHRAAGSELNDVLGILAAARHEDGTPLSDDEIRDELETILLAGHETTAVALTWALYELARHPSVLRRLRDELDALGPDPDPDVLVKQRYLGAVCDETLRLHTILTEVARMCNTPLKLSGYTLPKGTGVGVAICAIHQDPGIFPEPEKFLPERFIERSYSPFEFLPFGGGHRRCIGAAFSDYEMRIALATVVTRWELEALGKERDARHNIGMGPKHGVLMRVKGRRHHGRGSNGKVAGIGKTE